MVAQTDDQEQSESTSPPEPATPEVAEEPPLPSAAPVSVVYKKHPPPRETLQDLNRYLSEPWTAFDRENGRAVDASPVHPAHWEFTVEYYQKAGWDVKVVKNGADAPYFLFQAPKASTET